MTIENWQKCYDMVKEFQDYFDGEIADIEDEQVHAFRMSLINEEKKELIQAIKDNDEVSIMDGLCDLMYVGLGSYVKFNVDMWSITISALQKVTLLYIDSHVECVIDLIKNESNFMLAFAEVHRSNMSKACTTIDEAHATIAQEKYKNCKFRFQPIDDKYLLFLDEDCPELELKKGKLIKSIGYSKANLLPFI